MTYLFFHLTFILPPLLLLAGTLAESRTADADVQARKRWAIPVISAFALSYTIPWDNYLVAKGVWDYGIDRVLMTIGYVPIEEYLFFVLQPILTGLFLLHLLHRADQKGDAVRPRSAWIGFLIFLILTGLGAAALLAEWDPGFYMGLILVWACPLLAAMWLYGGETYWAHRTSLIYGTLIPTLYLCIADAVAIATGVWSISSRFTLGVNLFGLPIEEATFFLVTNLLVVKGILLLLYDAFEEVSSDEPVLP